MEDGLVVRNLVMRIEQLEQRLADLETRVPGGGESTNTASMHLAADAGSSPFERRQLLLTVGKVAAVGAGLALLRSERAAAATGGNLIIGQANSATSNTRLAVGTDAGTLATAALTVVGQAAPCPNGIFASASNIGGGFVADRIALQLSSPASHLQLLPTVAVGTENANLLRGEIRNDGNGDVWYQHTNGVGNAHKLAGPGVAGAFHVVAPTRVYDGRGTGANLGPLAAGTIRSIVIGTPVPAGAKAIVFTLTITNTTGGGGYLGCFPGGTAYADTSSINWFGPGQNLATTVVSGLGAGNVLNVYGGGNATDFLIDITGYYR